MKKIKKTKNFLVEKFLESLDVDTDSLIGECLRAVYLLIVVLVFIFVYAAIYY